MNGMPGLPAMPMGPPQDTRMPIWKAVLVLFLIMFMANLEVLWQQFAVSLLVNITAFGTGKKTAIIIALLLPSLVIPVYGWIVLTGFKLLLVTIIVLDLFGMGKTFFPN